MMIKRVLYFFTEAEIVNISSCAELFYTLHCETDL